MNVGYWNNPSFPIPRCSNCSTVLKTPDNGKLLGPCPMRPISQLRQQTYIQMENKAKSSPTIKIEVKRNTQSQRTPDFSALWSNSQQTLTAYLSQPQRPKRPLKQQPIPPASRLYHAKFMSNRSTIQQATTGITSLPNPTPPGPNRPQPSPTALQPMAISR